MSNNFEMIGLFPVPLLKIKFKHHYKYNFPEVEKRDKKPDSWKTPVHTTFPNISDDDSLVPSYLRDNLKRDLKSSIVEVSRQLNLPTNIHFPHFWYNIYHDYQGQERHNHIPNVGEPLPLWAAIYYNKNASPTRFFKDGSLPITQRFDGFDKTILADCLAAGASPPVEDGDILLFPPHLDHCVLSEPYHRDNMRMTFSFNINLTT